MEITILSVTQARWYFRKLLSEVTNQKTANSASRLRATHTQGNQTSLWLGSHYQILIPFFKRFLSQKKNHSRSSHMTRTSLLMCMGTVQQFTQVVYILVMWLECTYSYAQVSHVLPWPHHLMGTHSLSTRSCSICPTAETTNGRIKGGVN